MFFIIPMGFQVIKSMGRET